MSYRVSRDQAKYWARTRPGPNAIMGKIETPYKPSEEELKLRDQIIQPTSMHAKQQAKILFEGISETLRTEMSCIVTQYNRGIEIECWAGDTGRITAKILKLLESWFVFAFEITNGRMSILILSKADVQACSISIRTHGPQ